MRSKTGHLLITLGAVAAVAAASIRAVASETDFEGTWVGRCEIGGQAVFLRLQLEREPNGWVGAARVRTLGIAGAPVSDVDQQPDRLALTFRAVGTVRLSGKVADGAFEGTAASAGKDGRFSLRKRIALEPLAFAPLMGNYEFESDNLILIGQMEQGQYRFLAEGDRRIEIVPVGPLEFAADDLRTIRFDLDERGAPAAAVLAAAGQPPVRGPRVQLYDEQRMFFTSGGVRLAGSLVIPRGEGPFPALVFVHGSGPQEREGYRLAVDRFARGGVACFIYDKRGTGESGGDWRQADFDDLTDDALAAVRWVRSQPRIAADKVGLRGASQAGWVIPLAAARSQDVAFIIVISGGAISPAEQETWRRRQNLAYLGVPEQFIEAGRKAAVMAFEWQRGNQTGTMPLLNPFASDNLNMYHDAETPLGRVRQPALVIFGELDTLVPPRESAGIWARALAQAGHQDFSVRLFPRGTHGMYVGEKTGAPFEVIRQVQFVSGFWDTLLAWIHHHTGGLEFADAKRVDVDTRQIPVEARGMHEVFWFGSGLVQPWLLVGLVTLFGSAVLAMPVGWLWRKARRREAPNVETRRVTRLAALEGLVIMAMICTLVFVLYQIADAQPHAVLENVTTIWNVLVAATWVTLVLGAWFLRQYLATWGKKKLGRGAQVYYALMGLAFVVWIPFVYYWDLLLPAR